MPDRDGEEEWGEARRGDFDDVPVNRFLGLEVVSRDDGEAELRMPVRREYLQETGVVQGGIISALADTAGVYAVWPALPADRTMTSIEFKMNFLRPATAEAGDLVARAELVRRGRRVALCLVYVQQDGHLVAMGTFTYLLFPASR